MPNPLPFRRFDWYYKAMDEKGLGKRLQTARRAAGLTQQELCHRAGLSYSTLTKIERGAIKAPSIFTIQSIAGALETTLDALMGGAPIPVVTKTARKISKNGVRFVYFDMNGCLVRFYNRAFIRLAEDAGVSTDTVESVFWHYNDDVCRGEMSLDEFNTILAQRLNVLVDWKRYYLESVEAVPGMNELVRWVADQYQVGLLTNTMPGFVAPLQQHGQLPQVRFDAVVDSSQVHSLKPEPAIYDHALKQAGVTADEILLIDDERPNLVAAEKLGWKTMWFDGFNLEETEQNIRAALEPAA